MVEARALLPGSAIAERGMAQSGILLAREINSHVSAFFLITRWNANTSERLDQGSGDAACCGIGRHHTELVQDLAIGPKPRFQ